MAMAYNEIADLNRGAGYNQNLKQDIYHPKNYMNFAQIPKGVKEKLNLPIKNSTYLKKMINKKSQQSNQSGNKLNPKSVYNSNVFPLYNTNTDNFKRSYSINDSKKASGNEGLMDGNNDNNYNIENNIDCGINDNDKINNNNFYGTSASKKGNSTKNLLGNSFNNYNNSNFHNSRFHNNVNNSRSKSNGKSNKKVNNPMMNLIRTYTGKSLVKENPATYRKYRAQTKSTDKLYQNTTKYPVHINLNDSAVADNTYNNPNEAFNRANAVKGDPYPVNEVNVNLSKYNDYEYYHNLSLQRLDNNNNNKINNNYNKNNFNNNSYNYNSNNNGFPNSSAKNKVISNSKMKKSFDVLSDILDSHFTVNSPNHRKINLAAAAAENDMRNGDSKLNLSVFNSNNNNNLNSPNFNNINNYNNNVNSSNQNLNMSMNKENLSGRDFYKDKIYQQNEEAHSTKLTINLSYLGENPPERYLEALEHIMTILDPIFERLTLMQKLEKFIENTDDHRRTIRLGSLVGIFIILKKFQIEDEFKILILEKIVSLLHNYETQEELFLVACLEIAGLFAPCDLLLENINLISMFLTDFHFPKLQKAAFNCLMLMEYDGLKALVDLASKDFKDYTRYILNCLINTPHIQKSVIIRALINEIYSNHPDKRHAALAALNRMHDLIAEEDMLHKLAYFFKDSKIEKIFLASTLRTAGEKGEKILLKELKTNNEFSVRVAIASVLAYRTTKHPNYLEIRLDRNDTFSIAKTLPGSFCTYYGKISPYVYERILSEQEQVNQINLTDTDNLPYEEYLQVNSRDFLAALQRLISINYNHSNPKLVHRGNYNYLDDLEVSQGKSDAFAKYIEFFKIEKTDSNLDLNNNNVMNNTERKSKNFNSNSSNFNNNNNKNFSQSKTSNYNNNNDNNNNNNNDNNNNNYANNPNNNVFSDLVESSKNLISEEAIRGLCFCLKDYSSAVRECSANSLAHIALPEAMGAVGSLIEALSDGDVVVRSKVVAAVGKIASGCENAVIQHVVEALKTNFWKVKLACMNTLAEFGARAAKSALPNLHKLLRESAINKQNIADTIVRLGHEGESVLLKILTTEDDAQHKLKSVIAKALSLSAINGPNIDFIVETLFKASNSDNALIRLNALMSIKSLADRADESITYLKRKNIIPFYYNKLTDKDLAIQSYAIEAIKHLGPQGELIFIEGLSKDSNPIIRANCAIGLANIGPHTIRTLLIGLHDENKEVRKIVEKEITSKFAVYEILELFSEKNSQKLSLKIAIRDILEKCDSLQAATRNYFNDIIINLDREIYNTNNHVDIDAHKKFKKDVDQYMETYGNEGLEEENLNKNEYNNYAGGEYQNPELKGNKNPKINSSNSFNRSYQRKL